MKYLRTLIFSAVWLVISLGAAAALGVVGAALYFAPGLPDVRQLQDFELQTPLRIYTRDGQLIGEFGEERRMPVDFEDIPEPMLQALMAAEDSAFFEHPGVDPKGLARAAVELVSSGGDIQSGGSTITMQAARSLFLPASRSLSRKLAEAWYTVLMELIWDKKRILEIYLNTVDFYCCRSTCTWQIDTHLMIVCLVT